VSDGLGELRRDRVLDLEPEARERALEAEDGDEEEEGDEAEEEPAFSLPVRDDEVMDSARSRLANGTGISSPRKSPAFSFPETYAK